MLLRLIRSNYYPLVELLVPFGYPCWNIGRASWMKKACVVIIAHRWRICVSLILASDLTFCCYPCSMAFSCCTCDTCLRKTPPGVCLGAVAYLRKLLGVCWHTFVDTWEHRRVVQTCSEGKRKKGRCQWCCDVYCFKSLIALLHSWILPHCSVMSKHLSIT